MNETETFLSYLRGRDGILVSDGTTTRLVKPRQIVIEPYRPRERHRFAAFFDAAIRRAEADEAYRTRQPE